MMFQRLPEYVLRILIVSDHAKYIPDFDKYGIPIFKPYDGGKQNIKYGGFKIHAFPLPHDGVECRGFLIEHDELGKLLYLTDFEYCKYSFKSYAVNHIIVEANYSLDYVNKKKENWLHVLQGHAEQKTTMDFIKANITDSLKTVLLCHLSQCSIDGAECIEEAKKIALNAYVDYARAGLEIEL